jgi:alanine dehydrogenase
MSGAVTHTSTYALTNTAMACVLEIADRVWKAVTDDDPVMVDGVNLVEGWVTHPAVEDTNYLQYMPIEKL